MKNKIQKTLFALLIVAGVSACGSGGGNDAAVLDPEAYEYKGAADPLTQVSGADRAPGLADRFDLVQGRQ